MTDTNHYCRVCSEVISEKDVFFNVSDTPLADKFPVTKEEEERYYPINIVVCPNCRHVQMLETLQMEDVFNDEYTFYSGASPSLVTYWQETVNEYKKKFKKQSKGTVIEIASNDGTLLKNFVGHSKKIIGVDPSFVSGIDGVIEYNNFFNHATAVNLEEQYGKADMIIANNVIAHVENPRSFIRGINTLLSDEGVFICEFQYLISLLYKNLFENFYHEHRSFFSINSFNKLLEENGLYLCDLDFVNRQGGSLRVFVRRKDYTTDRVKRMLTNESNLLHGDTEFVAFGRRCFDNVFSLKDLISNLQKKGATIAGYGATAKSCTLLHALGDIKLDYIVDLTPDKIGKYSPGFKIPVISPDQETKRPDYYLLFAWNYADRIIPMEADYLKNGGHFILPTPSVIVI